ncbi:4-sulfomuconolactone hydrolase [Pandoraea pneumonica]|jgi:2-pyrone-4,6-dicarboxylate lactonase|uniref:4-sulfomuconolactone hydrolase n=1 Tax=Pandoraea pneumonica TaxID=2508299 RepID=A0A5E4U200_9BURK|nr:amidohydrolase family protein [Pandoraea pneumonica]VVD92944.1 4-sulfomuconolactone hydrolase [Pandoraea pneumonica]
MATQYAGQLTSTPMRAASTLARPTFEMPENACDAHMHVFESLAQYPSVGNPQYTLPDGPLAKYREVMDALSIRRFAIVQPSFYGTDNRCLLDALAKAGDAARGVVMIDEGLPAATLDDWHRANVRAIRLDLFSRAEQPTKDIQAYITRMAALCESLGWHLQFYAPGPIVRNLIPFLADVRTPFVIDHMGYMTQEDGLTSDDFTRLLQLLKDGNCTLKLSAPYRVAKLRPLASVAPMAKAIIETAPDKVIWGSDWPHIPMGERDTGELLNLLADWTTDAETRRKILVDNPARLYDFA